MQSKRYNYMGQCLPNYKEMLSPQYIPKYIKDYRKYSQDLLNLSSIITPQDQDRKHFQKIFTTMKAEKKYQKALLNLKDKSVQKCIASLLGLAICDALGASTEFKPFVKEGYQLIKQGFQDIKTAIDNDILDSRAGKIGIWTDDCSMALCIADSLIYNNYQLDPKHIRYLFLLWFFNGLNNGGRDHSIGLGGNIKISMEQFMHKQSDVCQQGEELNNGNGSLMRLAPIPIAFRGNVKQAMFNSQLSSRTTHNGIQAKQCCRLLSFILTSLFNNHNKKPKQVLDEACKQFQTQSKAVLSLALSTQQTPQLYQHSCKKYGKKFMMFNQKLTDRNWDWKSKDYTYSSTRFKQQPGYIGSYCMDALAMALHTIWYTHNFKQVAMMNANMGGDCDTVGAIAGQIAGAMYGIDNAMLKLYSQMQDFKKGRYQVFLKGYKLAVHKQ